MHRMVIFEQSLQIIISRTVIDLNLVNIKTNIIQTLCILNYNVNLLKHLYTEKPTILAVRESIQDFYHKVNLIKL